MSEMEAVDRVEDRTFRVNFSSDGVTKLRERVKDKLKEYMGDYTDDTLVEYVIVLLRNGRRKEEARNELNVFLGDDSHSFISWLWDHLASNLDLYVQNGKPHLEEEGAKPKHILGEKAGGHDSQSVNYDSERGRSNKSKRSRHNREWNGLVRDAAEPPAFLSSEIVLSHKEENTHHRVVIRKRSPSPLLEEKKPARKKRNQADERQELKRESLSQATINAPRRLLQFAVRDAVATSSPRPLSSSSNLATKPSLKRLRSMVSTSTGDSSLEDHHHHRHLQSVTRLPSLMTAAIKAASEAAEDVIKVRSTGNVFDRLGRGTADVSEEITDQAAYLDGEYGDIDMIQRNNNYTGQFIGLESETSENEGYDDVNVMGRQVNLDASQLGSSSGGIKHEDSLLVQYSVAKNADEVMRKTRAKNQDQTAGVGNASRKIVNISVNVNTWKPPNYQEAQEAPEVENRKVVQKTEMMKENSNPIMASNGNVKPAVSSQKETQKLQPPATGLYSISSRPSEDADSRTIFVNNVHFAATKDSLSRHFNKFGEVLKVVILTDAATGQPRGSAYVEFIRKEAAENALSLDGTSFMSRILKVVRRSSAHQETVPVMTWPRTGAARFGRVPFPRGITGTFRPPRLPIKTGARSMQWKRDAQPTPTEKGGSTPLSTSPTVPPPSRSLTYIRPELKPAVNSGAA